MGNKVGVESVEDVDGRGRDGQRKRDKSEGAGSNFPSPLSPRSLFQGGNAVRIPLGLLFLAT